MTTRMGMAALACCVALAGVPMVTMAADDTATVAGDKTPDTRQDHKFAKTAYLGNMNEVKLGQLALKQSTNQDVRTFAQKMVDDHQKAQEELTKICVEKKLSLPTDDDHSGKAMYDHLAKLSGADFDKAYINHMVDDHKTDIDEYQKGIDKKIADGDLKAYATKTLAVIQGHLKMAEDVQKTLNGGTANEGR